MFRMLHLSELVGIAPVMSYGHVPALISPVLEARTGTQLVVAVSKIVHEIGFESLMYAAVLPGDRGDGYIAMVTTMSGDWADRYYRKVYFDIDPSVQSCLRHAIPFVWDSQSRFGARGEQFFKEAGEYGVRSGITVPIRSPMGEKAMFGLNSSSETLPEEQELELAVGRIYLFASYFHEWFFHSVRNRLHAVDPSLRQVSNRELEVLALAARGHSSKRIGRELGISESTANFHIASVKHKFGVRTRSQAIAQAVHAGLIR
jgi:DNA-binding CsgD family transcriptional regulator